MPKFIEEYLYSLRPVVDEAAMRKATGEIESWLAQKSKKFDNYLVARSAFKEAEKEIKRLERAGKSGDDIAAKKKELGYDEKLAKMEQLFGELDASSVSFGIFNKGLKGAGAASAYFQMAAELTFENVEKLLSKSEEISNKFISGSSIFVDTGTRDLMAKFGVSSTTAQGMSASMEALGISSSDFGRLTQGQVDAYNRLMGVYQEGIDAIDVEKLEKFNAATQEYQLKRAEFDLKIQTSLMKIFAESETLPKMMDSFGDLMDTISKVLSSPVVQWGFDVIAGLLDNVLNFLDGAANVIGFLFGGSMGNTTTINVNSSVDARGNSNYNAKDTANEIYQEFSNQYGLGA